MFARNLLGALLVVIFMAMGISCITSTSSEAAAHTQLPLAMSHNTLVAQTVVTKLVASVN